MSQGGAVAIAYAARHPERVSHLIFAGAYARGALRRGETEVERLEAETLVNLIRVGWGRNHPAFRQVFPYRFIPRGTPEQLRWWGDLEQMSASPEIAARTLEAFNASTCPTWRGSLSRADAGSARSRRRRRAVR